MTGLGSPPASPPAEPTRRAGPASWILLAVTATPLLRWLAARYAVPVGRAWREACDECGLPLAPAGSSWSALLPPGRCGRCGSRVGAPPYAVEALAVVATVIAIAGAPSLPVAAGALWWSACAVPLLFVDLRVHRLPDVLTYAAAGGVIAWLAVDAAVAGRWDGLLRAAAAAAAYGAIFLLVALLFGRRGIGFGDAKLVVSLAALLGWWGWGAVFAAIFLAFLASGLVGGALLATRRVSRGTHIPMAPFLVAGTLTVLALRAWLPG